VTEILFSFLFFKTQSSIERSIVGCLTATIFISVMPFVTRLTELPAKKKGEKSSNDNVIVVFSQLLCKTAKNIVYIVT